MNIVKDGDYGFTITPQTAIEINFLDFLVSSLKAREDATINDVGSIHCVASQLHAQDDQPLKLTPES